mmetsp:Transcript_81963/g.240621  ORF Transcript_81963/g.240621 Transcript_81963/m.240621 type:complete len:261 (+) Transcript_81963:640-1422(+)
MQKKYGPIVLVPPLGPLVLEDPLALSLVLELAQALGRHVHQPPELLHVHLAGAVLVELLYERLHLLSLGLAPGHHAAVSEGALAGEEREPAAPPAVRLEDLLRGGLLLPPQDAQRLQELPEAQGAFARGAEEPREAVEPLLQALVVPQDARVAHDVGQPGRGQERLAPPAPEAVEGLVEVEDVVAPEHLLLGRELVGLCQEPGPLRGVEVHALLQQRGELEELLEAHGVPGEQELAVDGAQVLRGLGSHLQNGLLHQRLA